MSSGVMEKIEQLKRDLIEARERLPKTAEAYQSYGLGPVVIGDWKIRTGEVIETISTRINEELFGSQSQEAQKELSDVRKSYKDILREVRR